ncbi:hypothetical protein [Cellulosilyticum sp. WCF-2]|uniref:hypothetical protein n=1 Tax=Cellulosilyticum sp. WCF-2 TaxID=2497860 RepID=UPI000F8C425E|nr:hypothetical protein [Cellulosilyticum sp. WCF-2]QEH67815.1 hypothetical protein EKH84_05125 [Cellulosilyticum sp. WCF-2]
MHKKLILFSIAMMLVVTSSCSNTQASELKSTQLFVEKKMFRSDYGIKTTYHLPSPSYDHASGEEVLSESMGLMMLHYVYTKNESAFENLRLFCEEKLKNKPLYVYREGFSINALIDDFRLIEALLLAGETFNNLDYTNQALAYANVLYETNTANGHLVDFYDVQYKNRNNFLTLCYANFKLLHKLSTYDSRWQPILDDTKATVHSGFISDSFPLYRNHYDYTSNDAYNEEPIHIIHGLKTLLHLAEIEELPASSLQWLKQRIDEGTLYGSYSLTGEALTDVQSTAAYALAARIAAVVGDRLLYDQCIQRMEQYKIKDTAHEMFGSFGNAETKEAYSFDQLTALLAYDAEALLK